MNKYKTLVIIIAIVIMTMLTANCLADNSQPLASETISVYTIGFASNKAISLYCLTYYPCTISAKLKLFEKNDSTGEWDLVKTDTVTVYNATTLSVDKTYPEVKDGGSYKATVTYSAGGDSRTVSAERAFSSRQKSLYGLGSK